MSIALAFVAPATLRLVDIREIRRLRLLDLVGAASAGRGKQRRLAERIGKAPAQVSQWINRTRTITEDIAREIERAAKLPHGWMDSDPAAPHTTGSYVAAPPPATREAPPPPPKPPRDFSDRHQISATDWALLQDIKTAATPDELATIRKRAALIDRKVAERLEALSGTVSPRKK